MEGRWYDGSYIFLIDTEKGIEIEIININRNNTALGYDKIYILRIEIHTF